jgi:hypothetical protein
MADELGVAVDAVLHVVTERRGDLAGVDFGQVEADPEVEEVPPLAPLAESPDLGGEDLLDGEGCVRLRPRSTTAK